MFGIFLDTEANGLNPQKHRLIDIAYKIVDLTSGDEIDSYHSVIFQSEEIFEKSNLESLKINGFTYEDVKKGKAEKEILKDILKSFEKNKLTNDNSIFICQNPSFDRIFLTQIVDVETQNLLNWPYHWLDLASMFFAISIKNYESKNKFLPWDIGLSKDSIAAYFNLPDEKKPHKAKNGVDHLFLCYEHLIGFPCK